MTLMYYYIRYLRNSKDHSTIHLSLDQMSTWLLWNRNRNPWGPTDQNENWFYYRHHKYYTMNFRLEGVTGGVPSQRNDSQTLTGLAKLLDRTDESLDHSRNPLKESSWGTYFNQVRSPSRVGIKCFHPGTPQTRRATERLEGTYRHKGKRTTELWKRKFILASTHMRYRSWKVLWVWPLVICHSLGLACKLYWEG